MEFIAEVGSNYEGELDEARDYIRRAAEAGATAVKFQTLRHHKLVAPRIWSDGEWVENPVVKAIKNLELPDDWHAPLMDEAKRAGVEFISTPFYLEAVDLMESIGVATYKIASGDITFRPLLDASPRPGSASFSPPAAARWRKCAPRSTRSAMPAPATSRFCTASSATRPPGRRRI